MKVAYVHQLPVEIYPPATNFLTLLAVQPGVSTRAWSMESASGMRNFECAGVDLCRPAYPDKGVGGVSRLLGFVRWHLRVAWALARWKPDVILAVEPHSALAAWFYYAIFRGSARLFIHHHEYYSPTDFLKPGSRTSRICNYFERHFLYGRAEWVSETNQARLGLLMGDCPAVTEGKGRIWPNHPPGDWAERAARARGKLEPKEALETVRRKPLRLVCVGSLSFEDSFIREIAEWVVARPTEVSLRVCGYNIKADVWEWLEGLEASNLSCQPEGCRYEDLPGFLVQFDVALVLYKGNTLNFVHNVPNKATEALVCGLAVWYPQEMAGMRDFHREHPELPLLELDFKNLGDCCSADPRPIPETGPGLFSSELAAEPLMRAILRVP